MSLLGVDVGTSSCKAVVFSNAGIVLASSSCAYSRRAESNDGNEIDASAFWDSFVQAVRRAAEETTGTDRIEAFAISAHGETIIPIDDRGEPCGPALLNHDHRSGPLIPAWEKRFGRQSIYALTGLPVHPMYSLPKLQWLRENRPYVFARARKFATVADFLLRKMGLPPVIDYTMASRIMGFDIVRLKWSEELLGFVGLSAANFSEAVPSGTVIGKLDAAHARMLSLYEGVPVALGGHDQPCGAFGSGGVKAGSAVDSAGSYECVTMVVDEPKNNTAALRSSLNSYPHVVSGKYVVLGFFPSGIVVDWLLSSFFVRDPADEEERRDAFTSVQRQVEELRPEPTGICLTPHLLGSGNPQWDLRASLSASGIRAHHGRYHLYKALFEGIACELDINLRVLEGVAGRISRCLIFGGGSRWDLGVQTRCDITGRSLERIEASETVCRGAAMLAGVGAGVYRGFEDAVAGTRQATSVFAPHAEMTARYEGQVKQYAALYEGLERYRSLDASDHAAVPGVIGGGEDVTRR